MSTLPKLNSDYKYEMTLPVSGIKHRYRPYLVKEEKALLMANESEERSAMAIAMRDTLESCVEGADVGNMALADVEYAFSQVRARSAGETVIVREVKCEHCGAPHRASINLLDATITDTEFEEQHSIELQSGWILDVRWPSLESAINAPHTASEVDQAFAMMAEVMVALRTPDGMWDFAEVSDAEKQEFIESMNADQLGKVKEYIENMPQCKIDLKFTCTDCFEQTTIELKGIENFFG